MPERVSRAYARAEQEQSDMEKAKRSVDEKRPVYESKKRVAARPYNKMRGSGREQRAGGRGEGQQAREGGQSRDEKKRSARERGRHDGRKRERREEEGAATPGAILYWNLNNNYSV